MYLHTLPPIGVKIHIGQLDAILAGVGVSAVHGDLRGSIGSRSTGSGTPRHGRPPDLPVAQF